MAREDVNIAIAENHLDRFSEVVRRLKKAGLVINQEMEAIGTVSGSIEGTKLADIEQVEGVSFVERAREIRLPPPENDVQ